MGNFDICCFFSTFGLLLTARQTVPLTREQDAACGLNPDFSPGGGRAL
jgi:hypothetical protein